MKITAFCLCCFLILNAPGVMAQQPTASNQSWDELRQLRVGEKIEVERKTVSKKVSGNFAGLSDVELVIKRKRKNESFGRDEVKNIWRVAPPSHRKQVVFGTIGGTLGILIGVPLAVGLGFKECGGNCADEGAGIVALLIGLPVAGALIGRKMAGSGKRKLIYSAP
jgi:hypothetical protein